MMYRPPTLPFRCPWMLLAWLCWGFSSPADAALRFELQAGPTQFGEFHIDSVLARQGEAMTAEIGGIEHARLGRLGNLELDCPIRTAPRCGSGRLTLRIRDHDPLAFEFERSADRVTLSGKAGGRVSYRFTASDGGVLSIDDVPAGWIPSPVLAEAGLADLTGSLSGRLDLDDRRIQGSLRIRQLAFDTPDGRFAGAGLALEIALDWLDAEARVQLDTDWSAGELLLGPIYLPSPEAPLALGIRARDLGNEGWQIERLTLDQPQSLSVVATGRVVADESWKVAALDLEIERADLASLWRQGLSSVAGTLGWAQLETEGSLTGRVRIEANALASAGLRLSGVSLDDGAGRISIERLGAWLGWERDAEALELDANWQSARLLRIPLGAGALAFRTDASGTLALADSFRLPVLDGAIVVERLAWRDWMREDRQLVVDARVEPIDLAALTQTLGWTQFGGRLSGNFPGIQLSGGVIDVQGGLDIDLFGGRARINRLSIERPFGSLPALAADIEFEALDLEQVTGAFEFGRMLGLMSGHVRDLRLLDWQPVRFDAWFETLENSPDREISQKAVDSISSLSGGGSAAISGTLLRWFDDFPYRKAGLGCRLAANVCRMRGLRDADNGGYVILEGRLIPRLNIVGYQRRVDWPRLMSQLAAATQSAE